MKVGKIGMERCGEATVAEIVQAAFGDCKVSHATWTLSSGQKKMVLLLSTKS